MYSTIPIPLLFSSPLCLWLKFAHPSANSARLMAAQQRPLLLLGMYVACIRVEYSGLIGRQSAAATTGCPSTKLEGSSSGGAAAAVCAFFRKNFARRLLVCRREQQQQSGARTLGYISVETPAHQTCESPCNCSLKLPRTYRVRTTMVCTVVFL